MHPLLPLITAATMVGAALGGLAGDATVEGMRADAVVTAELAGAYGVPQPRAIDAPVEAIRYDEADCTDCSDYDIGWRWARERDLRRTIDCAIDSWSFQQGCEAAVRDARSEPVV